MSTRKPVWQRFWPKVDFSADCWLWTASINKYGYGWFRTSPEVMEHAHRVAYRLLVGEPPAGLHLDHLCRTRACVNPDHLEPVTVRTNLLRGYGHAGRNAAKTHCSEGHEFNEVSSYVDRRGFRVCRPCRSAATARWRQRRAVVA